MMKVKEMSEGLENIITNANYHFNRKDKEILQNIYEYIDRKKKK